MDHLTDEPAGETSDDDNDANDYDNINVGNVCHGIACRERSPGGDGTREARRRTPGLTTRRCRPAKFGGAENTGRSIANF